MTNIQYHNDNWEIQKLTYYTETQLYHIYHDLIHWCQLNHSLCYYHRIFSFQLYPSHELTHCCHQDSAGSQHWCLSQVPPHLHHRKPEMVSEELVQLTKCDSQLHLALVFCPFLRCALKFTMVVPPVMSVKAEGGGVPVCHRACLMGFFERNIYPADIPCKE